MESQGSIAGQRFTLPPRVVLGPGAPAEMADFLARAGVEVVALMQRHRASLYVDFVGAHPSGIEVLSIELQGRGTNASRPAADLVTESWPAAACLVISTALKLKPPLLTADPETLSVIKSAIGVAATQVPVVLCGEVGSGKYNLARLIHHASHCAGPLHSLNCASFDGLDSTTPGDPADGHVQPAVLYFDEIGELSDTAQIKLLALMQAHQQLPAPGQAGVAQPRFIAATNRSLYEMVERGELRRELFWRLNVFTLSVPPLRQRTGDLPMLARYFLRRANPRRAFTAAALKLLSGYTFPGNLLELENLVTRLALAPLAGGNNLVDFPDIRCHLMAVNGAQLQVSGWKTSREEARREMIIRSIAAAGGNRAEAARRLGITLRALQYHITKAGLSRPRKFSRRHVTEGLPTGLTDYSASAEPGQPVLHTMQKTGPHLPWRAVR
jgi:transcriptional regulator of acetoin/glycerol metabolism